MLAVGDAFAHYEIEGFLGQGGMGAVYRAFDTKLHRRVALKLLLVPQAAEEAARKDASARMVREARAAAALEHPNKVGIFELGEVEGVPYLAMEYIAGTTLRAAVRDRGAPLARRIGWLCDVARALDAAHAVDLVHRDIKPENVMVREDGVVKVLDFGIARRSAQAVDSSAPTAGPASPTLTGAGIVVGTAAYMPPEQVHGQPLDGRADQFAWGVMAFELVSGEHPWGVAADPLALVARMLTEPPRRLSELVPDAPEQLVAVVARALSSKRDDRFARMAEIVDALGPHAGATAPAASGPAAAGPPAGAPPSSTAVSAPPPQVDGPAPSTRPDQGTPPKRRAGARWWLAAAGAASLAVGAQAWRAREPAHVPSQSAPASASPMEEPRRGRPAATPAAAAAFEAATAALRDGNDVRAMWSLEEAVASDPALGAAQVHLAIAWAEHDIERARSHYQRALEHRTTLGEVDAALLDAFEPRFRAPPDPAERTRHLQDVARRFPGDAYVQAQLGDALRLALRPDDADAAYDLAIAADPHYVPAFAGKILDATDRPDEGRAAALTEQCLKVSPVAAMCLWLRLQRAMDGGRCADAKADAVTMIAIDPSSTERVHLALAEALAALGEPDDVVGEALRGAGPQTTDADRRTSWELESRQTMALLRGDLRAADQAWHELAEFVGSRTGFNWQLVAVDEIQVVLEEGDGARAATLLKALRARLRAKQGGEASDVATEALVLRMEAQAGVLDGPRLHAGRGRLLQELTEREAKGGPTLDHESTWLAIYGDAEDAGEAKEALAALARLGPVREARPEVARALGAAYALAGRGPEAVPLLRRVTRGCASLDLVERMHDWYALGAALEQAADLAGAREAYEKVLARWGKAKPRSVTADKARARLAGLARAR